MKKLSVMKQVIDCQLSILKNFKKRALSKSIVSDLQCKYKHYFFHRITIFEKTLTIDT